MFVPDTNEKLQKGLIECGYEKGNPYTVLESDIEKERDVEFGIDGISYYESDDYEEVKNLLIKNELFDPIQDTKINFDKKRVQDGQSIVIHKSNGKIDGVGIVCNQGDTISIWRFCTDKKSSNDVAGKLKMYILQGAKKKGIKKSVSFISSKKSILIGIYLRLTNSTSYESHTYKYVKHEI